MKYKKARIAAITVQTGVTLLVAVLALVFCGWQTKVACAMATVILVAALIAYAISYKALLSNKNYAYAFGYGYLGMFLVWLYCTCLIEVGIWLAAYVDCHATMAYDPGCVGTWGQTLGYFFLVFMFSTTYAFVGSVLGGLIAMLTKRIYQSKKNP
jgi:hypothetical protein